jgi:trk system potassium uptake protein TrkH
MPTSAAPRDLLPFSSIRFVAMSLRAHLTPLDLEAVLGQLAGLVRMMGWLLVLAGGSSLVLAGFAPQDAFFESASAIGTVGLSSGITDADLPAWIKLMLSLEMWAGRLEVLPVLVLLYPGTWKLRKRSR